MIVAYGYRSKVKIEKTLGTSKCPNCNHHVELALGKEKNIWNICFIPIFSQTVFRAKLCPNCGIVETYKKKEYKALKNSN